MKKNLKQLLGVCLSACILCSGAAGLLLGAAASSLDFSEDLLSAQNITFSTPQEKLDAVINGILTDSNAETALYNPSATQRYDETNSNATINNPSIKKTINLGNGNIILNTYPANQTVAGMTGSVPSLNLGQNEAVMSVTIDNFWIVNRREATEEEKKNPVTVVLGKNRGTSLSVNGQEVPSAPDIAAVKALIRKAKDSVEKANKILKTLQDDKNVAELQALIGQAQEFISQAENATDKELLSLVESMGYETLNTLAGAPAAYAETLSGAEQGTLTADALGKTLGINSDDLIAFAERSGFTLEGVIALFNEKNLTLQDFEDMLNILSETDYSIYDFIEAGVLDNEGVGGLVVRLEDSSEGMQVLFTSSSGITYQFCGAVVLGNGKQLQFGDCTNKQDTSQQFGEMIIDKDKGTKCFFSTVYNEALGLLPGEMLLNRYMLIQDKDENPMLYWFDETGAGTLLGPLEDVDPSKTIAKAFEAAGLKNGLPLKEDPDTFPEGFSYLSHNLTYTVQQPSTCVRMGIELIQCKNCNLQMAKNLPKAGHILYKTEKTEPTCDKKGTEEYWTCAVCHQLFSDTWGTTITAPVSIPKLAHTPETVTGTPATCSETGLSDGVICSVCKTIITPQTVIPTIDHTPETVTGTPATCSETGLSDGVICSVCKTIITLQTVIPTIDHTPETVTGTPATCSETGLTDGEICSVCKTVLTPQTIIPTIAHTLQTVTGTPATCSETGLSDGVICSVCKTIITPQTVIPMIDHTPETVTGTPATCSETGLSDEVICSVCKTIITPQTVIPTIDHTPQTVTGTPATCTETGLTDGEICSVCKTVLKVQEEIPKTAHTPKAPVEELIVSATCKAGGSYDSVVYCSECNALISSTTVETSINSNNHTGGTKKIYYDESTDGYYYKLYCLGCNAQIGTGVTSSEEMEEIGIENTEWEDPGTPDN